MLDYNAGASLTESVTACQTALATLQRLGRSADADDLLSQAESTSYSALDADRDHSDQWKLQRTHSPTQTSCPRLHDGSPQPRMSHPPNTKTTPNESSERRDCRAIPASLSSACATPKTASKANTTASNSNASSTKPSSTATTSAHTRSSKAAVNKGDADTVTAFQKAYPDLADATARLWNVATRGTTAVDIATVWRLGALKPPALQPLMDYEIAEAAAGQTNVGTWNVRT